MFKEHAKHDFNLTKSCSGTLTSVAQLLGHCPAKQKVTGSIPGQGEPAYVAGSVLVRVRMRGNQ